MLPANRAGPVLPESPFLFLLTSPGHNSNKTELGNFVSADAPFIAEMITVVVFQACSFLSSANCLDNLFLALNAGAQLDHHIYAGPYTKKKDDIGRVYWEKGDYAIWLNYTEGSEKPLEWHVGKKTEKFEPTGVIRRKASSFIGCPNSWNGWTYKNDDGIWEDAHAVLQGVKKTGDILPNNVS